MIVTLKEASNYLPILLKSGIVPYFRGSPAIGKSAIVHQYAKARNLKVIDIRLAECDPTDIQGFPFFDQETKTAGYCPLNTFPTTDTLLPEGCNGWVIFFDELSNAPLAVQGAAYKVILDRQVGQHKLHPNVAIVAAGNSVDDNAAANNLSSALISRMAIFDVEANQAEWSEWAIQNKVNHNIITYLNWKVSSFYQFDPQNSEEPYAAPRTWKMTSDLLNNLPQGTDIPLALPASLVGKGVAQEFLSFLKLQDSLIKFEDIIKDPKNCKIEDNLSIKWSLMSLVCRRVDKNTIKPVIEFIARFSADLKVVALREMELYSPDIKQEPDYQSWKLEVAKELYG